MALIVWLKVQVPTRCPFSTRIIYLATGTPWIVDCGLLSQPIVSSISRRFPPPVSGSFLDIHLPTQGFLIAQIHRRCRRLIPSPSCSIFLRVRADDHGEVNHEADSGPRANSSRQAAQVIANSGHDDMIVCLPCQLHCTPTSLANSRNR